MRQKILLPPCRASGKGAYREAMLQAWGKVPPSCGQGRPPTQPTPGNDWRYLQVRKKREGGKLVSVTTKVISGDPEEVKSV